MPTPSTIPSTTHTNSSFLPGTTLQFAWDSTSMGAFKTCPRFYQYTIIEGWTPLKESVHLTFGLHYHAALERYDHLRAQHIPHDEAARGAIRYILEATWNADLKRPWLSLDPNKNRLTLLRTVVWYLDQFREDPFETVILKTGKPAVELSFRFELEHKVADQQVLYCGHLDRVATLEGVTWIIDKKTTKTTLGTSFFEKYSPDNQFSGYILAGKVVYGLPVAGVVVDAAQVAVTFSRYERGWVQRTDDQLQEWYEDLGFYIQEAQVCSDHNYWPQNDKSCNQYGGCPFRVVCGKPPSVRATWLRASFLKRTWDPLQIRGDI